MAMAENKLFEKLSPDMLEGVSGGMSKALENALLADIADCKAEGISKADYLAYFASASDEEFAEAGTSREEFLGFIKANW